MQDKHNTTPKQTKETWIKSPRGFTVGLVRGETFFRRADPDRHTLYWQKKPSWSYELEVLERARDAGARWLQVDTPEATYRTHFSHFWLWSREVDIPGQPLQRALAFDRWQEVTEQLSLGV